MRKPLFSISSFFICLMILLLAVPVHAQLTEPVYVSTNANGEVPMQFPGGIIGGSMTTDGNLVVFSSSAADLIPGMIFPTQGNGNLYYPENIYIKNIQTGAIQLISSPDGITSGNGDSLRATITPDGRYVAFDSVSSNLTANDTNAIIDVFLVDRGTDQDETNNQIYLVSVDLEGNQLPSDAMSASTSSIGSISDDGNLVVFQSGGHAPGIDYSASQSSYSHIFLWNRTTQKSTLISRNFENPLKAAAGNSHWAVISGNGKYILYISSATDIMGEEITNNMGSHLYLYDVDAGTTKFLSSGFIPSSSMPYFLEPKISSNGNCATWSTMAIYQAGGDTDRTLDIFFYDRLTGEISIVNSRNYMTANDPKFIINTNTFSHTKPSTDCRYVAYRSFQEMTPGKTNTFSDIFVRDIQTGDNIRVSLSDAGEQIQNPSDISMADLTADGKYVLFSTGGTALVPTVVDENNKADLFRVKTNWVQPTVTGTTLNSDYLRKGPTSFDLSFSKQMTSAEGTELIMTSAVNPLNFVVIHAGQNKTIDTTGCNVTADSPAVGDDVLIVTDSVQYNKQTFTSTVNLNSGKFLLPGNYRMIACGRQPFAPRALHDAMGNKLNQDYIFDFFVEADSGVIIEKDAIPDHAQDFTFELSDGTTVQRMTLDDDADSTLANSGSISGLQPGTYSITETNIPSDWELDIAAITCGVCPDEIPANCQNPTPDSTLFQINPNSGVVQFELDGVKTIKCKYTNKMKESQIVVDMVTDPLTGSATDAPTFSFTVTGNGYQPFSLKDGSEPNRQILNPGTYTVAQTPLSGWELTGVTVNGTPSSIGAPIQISLTAGSTANVVFTSRRIPATATPTATAIPPTATATQTPTATTTAIPPTATATLNPTATTIPPTATVTLYPTATMIPPTAIPTIDPAIVLPSTGFSQKN